MEEITKEFKLLVKMYEKWLIDGEKVFEKLN